MRQSRKHAWETSRKSDVTSCHHSSMPMTPSDISYSYVMGRWQPDARSRLQEAAMALYGERGYDATTVAEIAERAGLTKRTFFRYFTDKREVLFWGSERLEHQMVAAIETAPASASALGLI